MYQDAASEITVGHFGDLRLDGLRFAATFRWPGPLHEGGGVAQAILDERADEAQRDAILIDTSYGPQGHSRALTSSP